MNKKRLLCAVVVLLCAGAAFSQDYGLTLRSLPVFTNGDDPSVNVGYTGTVIPWFAAPLGERGDLYLSGGISAEYADEEWKPVPELYRFEILYRFGSGLRLEAGRLPYREPLNMVMNGLFDGLAAGQDLGKTRLSVRALYTGLLYKKTAWITMNSGDYAEYQDRDRYFASRRLVFSLDWEIPGLFDTEGRLDLGLTGQFDLNEPEDQPEDQTDKPDQTGQVDGNGKIHSQYALAKFTLPFLNSFNAELGTLLGLLEEDGREPGFCFAFSGALAWLPSGGLNDRLSLNMAVSSGAWDDTVRAFLPINTIAQGKVLRPKISGLALTELVYTARLHNSLSTDIEAAYFFRTDSRTYSDPELDGDSLSPLLGGEVHAGLTWAPVSDVSFTLGGGAFFPQWGKAFVPDTPARWRVSLETILSF
ncbi:MAG: hypothetical protein LBK83_08290 [Treponema sp.]|jgi:hypothetical protein|nr:hypothetical protein [Treponema sp.]